ncbi:MAG TPA: prepilin peptidase [Candidatus Saccharimonadales bacterium]|nr:prepilin peptidase [Candidatus Saccharimonadales bacterium]
MIWVILVVFGLCAGSFVSAVVWRVRQQELSEEQGTGNKEQAKKNTNYQLPTTNYSVLKGRSVCPHCHHILTWYDLLPLFSWLALRGRCRYCGKRISWQYPLTEVSAVAVFTVSYAYWPGGVYGVGDWLMLIAWLLTSVGLLALLIYDLKWMILPNKILYPTLAVAVSGRLVYILSFEPDKIDALINWALSLLIASGLFLLIYTASSGRWIGFGDVRLGLILGTVLSEPLNSMLMIFVASVLGTAVILPALITGRRKMTSRLPFGPFLISATFLVLIFGQGVVDWYKDFLG